jgi:DNA-binding winged helix-turn-helix (wHTH) protein
MRLRFGECVLDGEARELQRDGRPVHLSPKAFDFLTLLLSTRPRAVAKAELLERLWPGTYVSDDSLSALASEARTALADHARSPRFLRTVFGFGYAFCGTASEDDPSVIATPTSRNHCRLRWGKREIPLAEGENLLGRTEQTVVWLESESVSRRHARILVSEGRATLEDLGSKNGTWIGDERVTSRRPLADGDRIRLGELVVVFRCLRAVTTATSPGE